MHRAVLLAEAEHTTQGHEPFKNRLGEFFLICLELLVGQMPYLPYHCLHLCLYFNDEVQDCKALSGAHGLFE